MWFLLGTGPFHNESGLQPQGNKVKRKLAVLFSIGSSLMFWSTFKNKTKQKQQNPCVCVCLGEKKKGGGGER